MDRYLRALRVPLVDSATIPAGRRSDARNHIPGWSGRKASEVAARYVPITEWLPGYRRSNLSSDAVVRRSPSGPCSCHRRSPTRRSRAHRRKRASSPRSGGCPHAVRTAGGSSTWGRARRLPSLRRAVPVAATYPATQYPVLLRPGAAHRRDAARGGCAALRARGSCVPVLVGVHRSGVGVVIIVGSCRSSSGFQVETGKVQETLWALLGSSARPA